MDLFLHVVKKGRLKRKTRLNNENLILLGLYAIIPLKYFSFELYDSNTFFK